MASYSYSMVSLASLLVKETKAAIYDTAIGIAKAVGLPVSTWQAGDPTRSLYHLESEVLSKVEDVVVGYIESGFLDYASGDWLKIVAKQGFNVDVPAATFATTEVVLTNSGGGVFQIDAGDLTLKNTLSGKTYRNTTGGTLPAKVGSVNGTLTITVVAEEAGAASSAGSGEIDDLVTTLLKVTCSNPTAAVGTDEQAESVTRQQCRDKLGNLSPNGPRDIYSYVAKTPALVGTTAVTRTRVFSSSDSGDVTLYIAGPSGAVGESDRALVETGIATHATPLCVSVSVVAAIELAVPITYELWLYKSSGETASSAAAKVQAALGAMFATRPIGGDLIPPATTGKIYKSMIESVIRSTFPDAFRVVVTAPASDVTMANNQVAVLSTVTPTVDLVVDP
jgi:hypothetical protein